MLRTSTATLLLAALLTAPVLGKETDRFGAPLPPGAIARYGNMRFHHAEEDRPEYETVELSDEERERLGHPAAVAGSGELIAAGSTGGTVTLWGPEGDRPRLTLVGHSADVERLLFLPGSRLASAAEDGTVRIWDLQTGSGLATFEMPDGPAERLRLGAEGKVLFADTWLAAVRFDLLKLEPLDPGSGHSDLVELAAISPDGKLVASSADSPTIHLWEAGTGKPLRILRAHVREVTGLAFSPGGGILASTDRAGAVLLWDTRTWKPRRTNGRHYMRAHRAAFDSATGMLVTGGVWGQLKIWDPDSGAWIGWIEAHANYDEWEEMEISSLACSPDGATVASIALDGRIELHDYEDGRLLHARAFDEKGDDLPWRPRELAYSPDGKLLAVIGREAGTAILEAEDLSEVRGNDGDWTALAWSPTGDFLAVGDDSGALHLLDPADLSELTTVAAHADGISDLAFSRDGRRLVTASCDGTLLVFDAALVLGRELSLPVAPEFLPPREPPDEWPTPLRAGRADGLLPGEALRPYPGFVPGAAPPGHECILVIDGTTGSPIRGAKVLRFEERDPGPPGNLLDGAVTDEHGLAWLDRSRSEGSDQWVIDADGCAAQSELRSDLPAMTVLFPGRTYRGRVLDPFGEPAAGVEVELFAGCGHSPGIRRALTDADGVFELRQVNADQGRMLWFTGGEIASRYVEGWPLWRRGGRMPDFVTMPGRRLDLRVVDSDGRPVPGMRFCAENAYRGPWATTDHRGRCTLRGLVTEDTVRVFDPDPDGSYVGELLAPAWFTEGRERVVARPPIGRELGETEEVGSVPVAVQPVDAGTGEPVHGLPVTLVSIETGRRFDFEVGEWEEAEPPEKPVVLEAPEGRYLLGAGGPLARAMGGPVEVEVVRDRPEPLRIPVRRNARLDLSVGKLAKDAALTLVAPRAAREIEHGEGRALHVPHDGPAAVHLGTDRVKVYRVGPAKDGVRTVTIDPTAEQLAELEDDAWDDEAESEERPEIEVVCRLADGEPVPGARIVLWESGRRGIPEEGGEDHADAGGSAWVRPADGDRAMVEVQKQGLVPILRPLRPELEIRWSAGTLDLTVVDEEGGPLDFGICLDGRLVHGEDGRVKLGGLAAGRHALIVGSPEHHSQLLEFNVENAGARTIRVELPKR